MDAVGSLVYIVEKLSSPLIQEASSLCGVGEQVEWIKGELTWMQCFLKDAAAKQEGDERVKNWVRTVRDLAYDVEDIIDTFVLKIEPLRQQSGLMASIKRYAFVHNELKARHKLASDIERIKTMIFSVSQSRTNYGIQNINLGDGASASIQSPQDWRPTSPDVQEQDFVGFEKDLKTLVARFTTGERRLCVVSVVGMGGLGKTTIRRKVYKSDAVGRHFKLRAWVSMPQEYVVKDLLQAVLRCCVVLSAKKLKKVEKRMSTAELSKKIAKYLKEKRFLIVLDDVWQYGAWDDLKDAFPDMKNGSRILLTTRNKDVALRVDAQSPPHELRFLTEDESWELFCKKSFLEQGVHGPQDLQKLGREIVKRCQGLPLAIAVIGGLLSTTTKERREWEKVLKSMNWQFVEGEGPISRILSLSYKALPYHLKPCFLYLGIFPEDYNFSAKNLIELWLAEGFLKQRGNETLEEVGEDCLKELVQRSMVQVAERSSAGGIKSCRIHNLLRDLCISEAHEEKLLEILGGNENDCNRPPASTARRLAIHDNALNSNSAVRSLTRRLRSVFLISSQDYFIKLGKEDTQFFFHCFKFLRVLSFHAVPMESLPNEIGELIHLRYLGCTGSSLKKLPPSIGNLRNLQILNVTSGYPIHITSAIEKIHQLRHLRVKCILNDPFPNPCVIEGRPQLDKMSNLQTLTDIVAGQWIHGCLGKLTNLRKLGIYLDSSDACEKEVYKSILKLRCLESLFVSSNSKWGNRMLARVPLTNLLKYPPKLCKLYLQGQINKLPDSCEFPINLAKLTLEGSFLRQDSLQMLEKLENLRILRLLEDSYAGEEMACSAHGFPRLEYLEFYSLKNLKVWKIEEGTLPSLLHLRIKKCPQLKMLPEGLQRMTALKKLDLWGMRQEFKNRLRKDDGDDWRKIQNISSIDIIDTWVQ